MRRHEAVDRQKQSDDEKDIDESARNAKKVPLSKKQIRKAATVSSTVVRVKSAREDSYQFLFFGEATLSLVGRSALMLSVFVAAVSFLSVSASSFKV